MALVLRALLFVGGLFFVLMGIGFLLDPVGSGADFGIAPQGTLGLASMRADMTAFFVVAGGCMIWGGWARKGDPLLVTAALMAIAIIGRLYTLILNGPHDDWFVPIIVEAVTVILALLGSRMLPHTALIPEESD
ncbi:MULTISPECIES: DUF4345 family protein [Altererythrobacter]|uniref:Uncharacterized protein DUF4345 n=1 Tax=Altererythrobacter ishigakiensis TaxID=476157 RepID=A0A562UU13_9SPHN|nr:MULTISPECIES: DUF4345 family protein [Altererythrobacter]MBO6610067.1 DUF4345 family protein [Altererythrobacter sp.]MBO6642693.1 DUF4345 family protein [Altererythrobacter sp.]MBO6708799.1 DUF4345 family protein [Altererythrobacter sp.]MBO6945093.1 DUF4345 family protein [Altererythrobacter sp.]TWJ09124.1 uncharacterized protein DUF4345 [Altererythrobacter ishigakiensis]